MMVKFWKWVVLINHYSKGISVAENCTGKYAPSPGYFTVINGKPKFVERNLKFVESKECGKKYDVVELKGCESMLEEEIKRWDDERNNSRARKRT